ncbi:MAG: NINE protein [Planctomycetaceae bacterium]|nr:NINE protein [Planctomycetaceae bacterium]
MTNFFYTDANGQKQGPINDAQLKTLAAQGIVTPTTSLETESGHKGVASQIPGLFAAASSPFAQAASVQNTPTSANLFCTNCGNGVSEQAVACMSCGARPSGHKKFCRQCGVALNPEQVVCVKCGSAISTVSASRSADKTKTAGTVEGSPKDKITAVLFAFFLGTFGAHWFYLGNQQKALLYLGLTIAGIILAIFFIGFLLIGAAGVLAIVDAIKLLRMSDEEFAAEYS